MTINMENDRLQMMWGTPILDEGFTQVPNMIVRHSSKLGVTGQEFKLLMILVSYKHDTKDPFPSQETLAGDMGGISTRQIRKIISGLEKKGLLLVGQRINEKGEYLSNVYNFKPLVDKCLVLCGESKLPEEKPKEKISWKKAPSPSEQNVPTLPEQNVPTLPEQNVPTLPEQNVPTKRKGLKEKVKKKIENHHLAGELTEIEKNRMIDFIFSIENDDDELLSAFIVRIYNYPPKVISRYKQYYKQVWDSISNERQEPIRKEKVVRNRFVSKHEKAEKQDFKEVSTSDKEALNRRLAALKNKKVKIDL